MTGDERQRADLFNDIAGVNMDGWLHLGDHRAIVDHLWAQGWRRERPHLDYPYDPCWCGVTHWDPGQ